MIRSYIVTGSLDVLVCYYLTDCLFFGASNYYSSLVQVHIIKHHDENVKFEETEHTYSWYSTPYYCTKCNPHSSIDGAPYGYHAKLISRKSFLLPYWQLEALNRPNKLFYWLKNWNSISEKLWNIIIENAIILSIHTQCRKCTLNTEHNIS